MSEVQEYDNRFEPTAVTKAPAAPAGQATMVEQARAIAEVRAAAPQGK